MSQTVRGVIARSVKSPVEIVDVVVPDPGPGEAVVQVQACGVCHTDLHYREGGINDEFPFLLGHEAAGVVEAVGAGVTDVAPGDFVILNWRAVCGQCRACRRGRPWYCFSTHNATQTMTLVDGTELSPALGIGAFAEKTLVAAGQCTKVDPQAPATVAGLLGCGVMAGIGAAINTGGVGRGDSIAVIGCGGVGSAAVAGARLAGAATIVGDRHRRPQTAQRASTSAPRTPSTPATWITTLWSRRSRPPPAGSVRTSSSTRSAGRRRTSRRSTAATWPARVVLVGVPTPDLVLDLPLIDVFGRGGSLKSSWYGDCLPSRDFPMLIDLFQQGRLPLDRFVSETIGLGDIEAAFAKMHHGDVLRSVVVF